MKVTMDSWSDKQIQSMKVGGNDKCNQFLQRYGIAKDTQIAKKYNSPAAAFYRRIIAAEADGLPAPVPPQSFEDGPGDVSDPIQRELKAREEVGVLSKSAREGSELLSYIVGARKDATEIRRICGSYEFRRRDAGNWI